MPPLAAPFAAAPGTAADAASAAKPPTVAATAVTAVATSTAAAAVAVAADAERVGGAWEGAVERAWAGGLEGSKWVKFWPALGFSPFFGRVQGSSVMCVSTVVMGRL